MKSLEVCTPIHYFFDIHLNSLVHYIRFLYPVHIADIVVYFENYDKIRNNIHLPLYHSINLGFLKNLTR